VEGKTTSHSLIKLLKQGGHVKHVISSREQRNIAAALDMLSKKTKARFADDESINTLVRFLDDKRLLTIDAQDKENMVTKISWFPRTFAMALKRIPIESIILKFLPFVVERIIFKLTEHDGGEVTLTPTDQNRILTISVREGKLLVELDISDLLLAVESADVLAQGPSPSQFSLFLRLRYRRQMVGYQPRYFTFLVEKDFFIAPGKLKKAQVAWLTWLLEVLKLISVKHGLITWKDSTLNIAELHSALESMLKYATSEQEPATQVNSSNIELSPPVITKPVVDGPLEPVSAEVAQAPEATIQEDGTLHVDDQLFG
jgi:hypothetical protein